MAQIGDYSSELILDFSDLLARVDNDRELLCELLELFKNESTALILLLKHAVAGEDTKGVETTGHTLKGMLANLSATRAVAAASRLQEIVHTGEKSDLKDAFIILESEMAVLLSELDKYLDKV